jgi:acyl-coenzyme A synthetase/AMP-(fatty) acid ligase
MLRAGKRLELYGKLQQITARACPAVVLSTEQNHGPDSQPVALQEGDKHWKDVISACSREEASGLAPHICQADDVINVLFSSGTTQAPKAIPWTHVTALRCGNVRSMLQFQPTK